jgi:pseudouridine-5'-phosphate glycosidase
MDYLSEHLAFSDAVRAALGGGRPVLALESTIVTHGMPWPRNLETARMAEQAVREAGVTPATIAIVDGVPRIGLDDAQLERLARAGRKAAKCSRRDIALLMHAGATAGTTVAATMLFAHRAGIPVFATGGIGGVHRGAAESLDISADLQELARTPVAVVCAGPKAILDLGLTLEYLETHGVPVLGYGTDELPAFYTGSSGVTVPYRLDTVEQIAGAIRRQHALGLEQGMVIANPPPAAAALDAERLDRWIRQAVEESAARGVLGKALTPYLLQRIEELSGGASLEANVALMLNNARLGAMIAASLAGKMDT